MYTKQLNLVGVDFKFLFLPTFAKIYQLKKLYFSTGI